MYLRRLFQFRLRTLLVLLTALSVWLGLHVRSVRMQQDVVQAIHDYGGWIRYDFQFPSGQFSHKDFDPKAESAVPKWLLDRLGLDFFYSVVQVNLNYSEDGGKREENHNPTDEALQRLANLPNLRVLLLYAWFWMICLAVVGGGAPSSILLVLALSRAIDAVALTSSGSI